MPADCIAGCVEGTIIGWLKNGQLGLPGENGVGLALFDGIIGPPTYMTPFGTTGSLWEFSTGTQVNGASIIASNFGTPVSTTPEPATLVTLGLGLGSLAGYVWGRRGR